MIIEKLSLIESKAENNINNEYKRLAAIRSIKTLLDQIDFSAEIVPMEDKERLVELLTFLKEQQLNDYENQLVEEIMNF